MLQVLDRYFRQIQNPFDKSKNILGEFLSEELYKRYRTVLTRSDHNLLDVIQPGINYQAIEKSIFLSESPIVLPDYESFIVFQDLVVPIIRSLNGLPRYVPLKPHPNSLFWPEHSDSDLEAFNLDPSGKVLQCLTIECSRNLKDSNFPCNLSLKALEENELELTKAFAKFYRSEESDKLSFMREEFDIDYISGVYCTLDEILERGSEILKQLNQHSLVDVEIFRGRRRENYWPSCRGVYIQPDINLAAWLNVQEHIKVKISTDKKNRGKIGTIYKKLMELMLYLGEHFKFERNEFLGFLAANPQFVGNGLKFEAKLKLLYLGDDYYELQQLCHVRGLTLEVSDGKTEYLLKNKQTLGLTEYDSFMGFSSAISNLIEMEKCKTRANSSILSNILVNFVKRKT